MWDSIKNVIAPGGEWWRLAAFFGAILGSLILGRLARFVIERAVRSHAEKQRQWLGVLLKALAKPAVFIVFAVGWHLAMCVLSVKSAGVTELLETLSDLLYAVAFGYVFYSLVDIVDHYLGSLAERTESKVDDVLAPLLGKSIRITIFVLVAINAIHVITDKSITTILAGLGVGGLAIALAGQDTIKNFFGSVVILGDKPFEIGDRVVVDGHDGPVESVGFRSTRIRTLTGHLVTVPNSEMVNKTVENIGKRPYIRRTMNIGITYNTPPEKVDQALAILKELLKDHEGMNPEFPPRVFFNEFMNWSLNVMVIYWYHPPDYWKYMAFSERLNRDILKRFNDEGIEFAFPTQTVCLQGYESDQQERSG